MNQMPLTMVLYGEPGAGKTSLACTTPGPTLIIDAESAGHYAHRVINGEIELPDIVRWNPGDALPAEIKDLCVITIDSWKEIGPIEDVLRSGKHPFTSVVVDSVTELQQRLVATITKDAGRESMRMDDWGLARNRFGNFLRALRDIAAKEMDNPINVCVFIALPKDTDNGVVPNLQGSVVTQLPGLVDLVGYVKLDTDSDGNDFQKLLISGSVAGVMAKCRSPHIKLGWPEVIANPHIENIYESVQPGAKKESA